MKAGGKISKVFFLLANIWLFNDNCNFCVIKFSISNLFDCVMDNCQVLSQVNSKAFVTDALK